LRRRIACLLALTLTTPTWLFADFQYTESTKVSGGSLMSMMKVAGTFSKQARHIGEPVTSSVYVSGNRMARVNPDHTEIVDLDRETVTHIDHQKKQYYTITFQQMKEQLEAAQREAAARQQEHPQPEPKPEPAQNTTDLKFDVNVRNTGAEKQYSGLDTHESILTLTMQATDKASGQSGNIAMTNDLWLTPEIPGYQEIRDFNIRYARKLGDVYGSIAAPMVASMQSQMKPGSTQGLGEMAKEVSKLKGVPIYTVMRMGSTTDGTPLPAASEAPLPASDQNADMPSKGDMAKQGASSAATNAIASKLGGFGSMMGGFGHKKKDPPPPPADDPATAQQQPTSIVLMETVSEMSGFSTAPVDPSHFLPPPGYQQVSIPDYRHAQ
jgi:hypothetical protein